MKSDKPPQGHGAVHKTIIDKKYLEYALYKKLQNRTLRVGVMGNIYQGNGANFVEADLSSVTQNISDALRGLGFTVTIFDMNKRNQAIDELMEKPVDFMFNVCERMNNNSLLEPHASSLLDILQIPYTGSNPQTLALAIDKIRVKKLLSYHGVPTPSFDYFYSMKDRLEEELKYPLIVKPANTDNSIGITNDSIVRNRKEFKKQLEKVIVEHKRPALVEEYIEGDEVDISILGNDETMEILPLSRSIFDSMPEGVWHIYPFEAKWGTGASTDYYGPYDKIRVERPAKYNAKLTRFIKEIAADTYHILDCHDYGRVEVRVDKDGNPFVLELNPNPSINKGDSTPNCAAEVGMDYNQFIYHVLELAIIRYIKNPPYFHLQVPDPGVRRRENILKWLNFRYPAAATGEISVSSPYRTAI